MTSPTTPTHRLFSVFLQDQTLIGSVSIRCVGSPPVGTHPTRPWNLVIRSCKWHCNADDTTDQMWTWRSPLSLSLPNIFLTHKRDEILITPVTSLTSTSQSAISCWQKKCFRQLTKQGFICGPSSHINLQFRDNISFYSKWPLCKNS